MVSTDATCFVIAPIGEEDSESRRRSDGIFNHVLAPAAEECGYKAIRADKMATPGIITNQVIQELLEAALVIADLTDHNANVYYELAIRHAVRKPLVEIIKKGQVIPFDVAATRVVQLDNPDLNNVEALRKQVKTAIAAVKSKPSGADNPITIAIDIHAWGKSGNPLEAQLAVVVEMLAGIRAQLAALQREPLQQPIYSGEPGFRGRLGTIAGSLSSEDVAVRTLLGSSSSAEDLAAKLAAIESLSRFGDEAKRKKGPKE